MAPFKVTSSKPQKTTGSKTTKAAAQRKSSAKPATMTIVSRTSNPVFKSNVAGRPAQTEANPQLSLPNGTPAVTPVAPPNIDPFLTPTDESQRAVEMGQWDDYISNLQLQRDTLASDVTLKVGDIDRSLAQGLEATDWNSAARGIQNSSIKDQSKAQMRTQAAATRGAETDKQTTFENHLGGQRKQVDTVYKPAITTKYNDLATRNAEAARRKWDEDHPPQPAVEADGSPSPEPTPAAVPSSGYNPDGTFTPANGVPTISAGGAQRQQEGYQPVVKNGKFYHYYPAEDRWVYIRRA